MPQGRIVLSRICESRKLAELSSDGARLLYTWLIPNVDIEGRFSGDATVVNARIFTRLRKSPKMVEKYLQDLARVGLIVLYNSDGDRYVQIPDFADKQPNLRADRESPSNIPPPAPSDTQSPKEYFQKTTIPIDLVRQVVERDGKTCQICGKVGIEDIHYKHFVVEKEELGREIAFEIDHIIPEYLGGPTTLENLRLVCRKCNRSKGFRSTPAELQQNSSGTPAELPFKLSKEKEKERFLDFVFLAEEEFTKLKSRFGEQGAKDRIQELNDAIGSKGYKYKSHYHTILNWARRKGADNPPAKPKVVGVVAKCSECGGRPDRKIGPNWFCRKCAEGKVAPPPTPVQQLVTSVAKNLRSGPDPPGPVLTDMRRQTLTQKLLQREK